MSGKKRRQGRTILQQPIVIAAGVLALVMVLVGMYYAVKPRPADVVAFPTSASTSTASSSSQPPSPTVVAFIGDSYTLGTGASAVEARWTTMLSTARHWHEVNVGVGATGFENIGIDPQNPRSYDAQAVNAAAAHPDLVIVSGGRNDIRYVLAGQVPQLTAAVSKTMEDIRRLVPRARIVVLNPWWDTTTTPAAITRIAAIEKAQAARVGATYIDSGQPLEGHPAMVIADGVHPNDAGHQAIADAVAAALTKNAVA